MHLKLVVSWLLVFVAGTTFAAERPNVLFIAIDDLRSDLGALGVKHAKTPQLDAFAKTARLFSQHYVQVPTCGASRCALLRGRYPTAPAHLGNHGIMATQAQWKAESLPAVFRQQGYQTLALGKISHHPGGLTGTGWATGPEELPGAWDRSWVPEGPWKTPEAMMHGYANGVARQPRKSPPWEAFDGPDDAYPDAWIATDAIKTLKQLAQQPQPWFFAVGFFKPHLPFAAPQRWYDLHATGVPDLNPAAAAKPTWPSGWHGSGEFRGNYGHSAGRNPDQDADYARQLRQGYAASISYMDAQVGRVLLALQDAGLDKNTIIVVWSDHGFLLGEHAIWGKHCLYEQALRSPLLIRHPGLPLAGQTSEAIVEAVDLFPTLVDLCGLQAPTNLDGHSLRPQLSDPATPSRKPAHGFWTGGSRSVRTEQWRLIVHPGQGDTAAHHELFDLTADPQETRNLAEAQPKIVAELLTKLERVPKILPARQPSPKPKKD
ncbi:MAG TPA: sulfatase [Pirellulaceae bacterium]|nr:sulfatase [Pirellulaceae bacterium]